MAFDDLLASRRMAIRLANWRLGEWSGAAMTTIRMHTNLLGLLYGTFVTACGDTRDAVESRVWVYFEQTQNYEAESDFLEREVHAGAGRRNQ
ncbi:MAG: hypothetical protein ACJAYU_003319 [Bradymonadia bacterium]|jgi:hypothetical protein